MAYSSIVKPTDYFNTKLYTGNGSTQALTGVGFQPDWVWIKNRTEDYEHTIFDSVRGVQKFIRSSTTGAEATNSNSLTAFGTDGFSIGTESAVNDNSDSFVSWNWLASGSTASNSNGSITSTVSANTTAGFSIVSFVGNATSGATVGHGLSAVPKVVIIKGRDSALGWRSYFAPLGATKYLELDSTAGEASNTNFMNDTAPTNQVFYLGNGTTPNKNGENYIAYCFAEKTGYSKFGSYTGNGNADGTFVYTGFKPAFFICKRYNDSGYDWLMYDNKRQVSFNVIDDFLKPNLSDTETTGNANQSLDFLSNGVKHRGNGASSNGSGASYIYIAFAENPFVANDSGTAVPVVAR
jgi:hypothetical protein